MNLSTSEPEKKTSATAARTTWLDVPRQRPAACHSAAPSRVRVGVVGGGLAGLVVAYRRLLAGDDVVLIEAGARLGGQIWTDTATGFVVERGAEGFAPASAAVNGLARDLELPSQIVNQSLHRSYGFDGRGLVLLEPGEAPVRLGLSARGSPSGTGIASFRGGMGQLVAALVAKLRDRIAIRLRDPVHHLLPSGRRWEISTGSLGRLRVDQLVLATGSHVAGHLLNRVGVASTGLERAQALSSVTVSLAYPRSSIPRELDGTGFTVEDAASVEGCRACTFSSSKLPGRSPLDQVLLRLFFRPTPHELQSLCDAAWIERATRVLKRALDARGTVERAWVDRWPEALTVVDAEQRERVAAVEQRFAERGVLLAGSAFHGTGIEGAVRSGEAAAAALDAYACAS